MKLLKELEEIASDARSRATDIIEKSDLSVIEKAEQMELCGLFKRANSEEKSNIKLCKELYELDLAPNNHEYMKVYVESLIDMMYHNLHNVDSEDVAKRNNDAIYKLAIEYGISCVETWN